MPITAQSVKISSFDSIKNHVGNIILRSFYGNTPINIRILSNLLYFFNFSYEKYIDLNIKIRIF